MKKLATGLIILIGLSGSMGVIYSWDPFNTSDWQKIGNVIVDTAKDVGGAIAGVAQDAGSWFDDRFRDIKQAFARIPECASVVSEGIQWAGRRGSYEVATGVLEAAHVLQQTDPVLTGLRTQLGALHLGRESLTATQTAANAGLDAVQGLAKATSEAGQMLGKILSQGINIKYLGFKMNLADLRKAKLPQFDLEAVIAGQKIPRVKVQLDLANAGEFFKSLFNSVKKTLGL